MRAVEEEIKREKAEEAARVRAQKADKQDRDKSVANAFAAARRGELAELKQIMDAHGVEATLANKSRGTTLLHAAAQSGSVEMAEYLISKGRFDTWRAVK
jgi:hypothetical protein